MIDYLEIGPTPYEESCAQVGEANYRTNAIRECKAFINQLRRQHGPEPDRAYFKVRANPHDSGTYHEVAIYFDADDPDAVKYAYQVEANCPARWDAEAVAELNRDNYPNPYL